MAERHALLFAVAGAALTWAVGAEAQNVARPVVAGDAASQRARAGDCAGALDGFDRAIGTSTNPELRRDRGACHDKLGHPFPAIDDYRAYLVARPNAADADAIHARLDQLESQVGILRPPGEASSRKGEGASVEMSLSTSGGSDIGAVRGGDGRDLATIERDEQLDALADASPLRRGHGLVLGLVFEPMNYTKSGIGWAEIAGLDLRYALDRTSTILLELNYDNISSSGNASSFGGAGLLGGYEARFALNPRVTDALLLAGTFGYEHLSQGASGIVYSAFQPRARFGYRHVFGPALGLEAALDGGVAFLHPSGSMNGVSLQDSTSPLIGGHVGIVLGF